MSTKRIEINAAYYSPLIDLNQKLRESSLSKKEMLLIYIKGSIINGCAYCIQSHIKEAVENGEKQYRIHALSAWEESPFFTKEEQLILKITEEVTHISSQGIQDVTYNQATEIFDERKLADIIMAAVCINAWNRIGRATQLAPFKSQE